MHRLVRISPFDAQSRRHTAFAGVEVAPLVEDAVDVEIEPDDLQIDTYRASGAGGQHVNKTDSAVRITHRPTGIVVQCQNERSQSANKDTAMKMLRAKLLELEERKRQEEIAKERGEAQDVGWGSQIRSYVLHPYTMVKDHRTNVEAGNVQGVLDGDLDEFVRAELLRRAGDGAPRLAGPAALGRARPQAGAPPPRRRRSDVPVRRPALRLRLRAGSSCGRPRPSASGSAPGVPAAGPVRVAPGTPLYDGTALAPAGSRTPARSPRAGAGRGRPRSGRPHAGPSRCPGRSVWRAARAGVRYAPADAEHEAANDVAALAAAPCVQLTRRSRRSSRRPIAAVATADAKNRNR